jgi:hypothetical protein
MISEVTVKIVLGGDGSAMAGNTGQVGTADMTVPDVPELAGGPGGLDAAVPPVPDEEDFEYGGRLEQAGSIPPPEEVVSGGVEVPPDVPMTATEAAEQGWSIPAPPDLTERGDLLEPLEGEIAPPEDPTDANQ